MMSDQEKGSSGEVMSLILSNKWNRVHNWKRDQPRFKVPAKISLKSLYACGMLEWNQQIEGYNNNDKF